MSKKIFSILLPVLFVTQSLFANEQAEVEKQVCKYSADLMITIAQQSLSEKSSRPERIEERRTLVEEWTSRMESGEDPCVVYDDIQNSVNTF